MRELDHVTVVLARPSEPRNIGAACRAAKNFGVTDLVVVGSPDFDREAARPLAIGAIDVFDSIRHLSNLADAVADYAVVAGTTRRTGQKRKMVSYWPWELGDRVAALSGNKSGGDSPRAAIVFGNETSGLTDEELQECPIAVSIPTSDLAPSLNLSHAVEVICYELWIAALRNELSDGPKGPAHQRAAARPAMSSGSTLRPASISDVTDAVTGIMTSLEVLGFHAQQGPQGMPQFLTDLIGRAGPSTTELARLSKLFADLAGRYARG